MGALSPSKNHPGPGYIFWGLVDPKRNRLASTAYFAIISSIILGAYCWGAFFWEDFDQGFFLRGLLTGYLIKIHKTICNHSFFWKFEINLVRLFGAIFSRVLLTNALRKPSDEAVMFWVIRLSVRGLSSLRQNVTDNIKQIAGPASHKVQSLVHHQLTSVWFPIPWNSSNITALWYRRFKRSS